MRMHTARRCQRWIGLSRGVHSPNHLRTSSLPINPKMVKALAFKGDKKVSKKRKRTTQPEDDAGHDAPCSKSIVPADEAEPDGEESWVSADIVSDLAGPVMLVMHLEPVMALACDQLGKVFASKVENMVEGVASSAEPHDVRQVFVATRVVGSDTDVVFKGCNGRSVLVLLVLR
jgi:protein FRG1